VEGGVLENPQPHSRQSGIGLIFGWKCTAGVITVRIDGGPPAQAVYGSNREDTRRICGDANNGYALLINWNLVGDGQHRIDVYDNGELFASAIFMVTTLGTEYLTGQSGTYTVNFAGRTVTLQWQESSQNFVIVASTEGGGEGDADLRALLGLWEFAYTIASTLFRNQYHLQRLETADGTRVIIGVDAFGDPVIAARIRDLISDPFPYNFALLDPGVIICRLFIFNQVTANRLEGAYIQLSADPTTLCGAPTTGNLYPMIGTRLSAATSALSLPLDNQEAMEMQADMRSTQQASSADELGIAPQIEQIVRELQRHQ
jgi:hypothetical protein